MVEALAQRVDAIQNGTHPSGVAGRASPDQSSTDVGVSVHLEIEDLKRKVERLIEKVIKNTVDAMENQILWLRRRLRILTNDDDAIVTAVEVQEQLH